MMNQPRFWSIMRSAGVLLVFVASLALGGLAEKDKGAALEKTSTNDVYKPFLINNVFNYYSNNGDGSYNKFSTDNEGFEFYKGGGKHIIFEDGVVWGGFHKGYKDPKVGGSVYRHGLQAGAILTNGTATTDPVAADASDPKYRVYRVRPDIRPFDFLGASGKAEFPSDGDAFNAVSAKLDNEEVKYINRYESTTPREVYDAYVKDWKEWPADLGAPFKYGIWKDTVQRTAADGPYDWRYDIPGQPGSDQTLWYTANDMSASRASNLSGSPSIGIEMHRTVWGYKRAGALGNTIFASSILINKSGAPVDSMFLVQWADPDLGDSGDDFAGCDSARSLGFVYNSPHTDATYGVACPPGGFDFFQGPRVPGAPTDSALFQLHWRKGFKNLPMTTFVFFISTIAAFTDPKQGPGGDVEWYRLMNARIAGTGAPFINPLNNQPTKFCLAGDPVKATDGSAGWVDGLGGLVAADRRICMVTGPFRMAAGDTQELVVANLGGLGADRLSSITVLRSVDDKAQQAYNSLFVLPSPPPPPAVTLSPMDQQVVLSWGDPQSIAKTEGTVSQGFAFEGYNVWEYPSPSSDKPILLGKFDLADGITTIADTVYDPTSGLNLPTVMQQGTDNGVVRSMVINASKVTGRPLANGTKYYFGVTAFSYNANPPAAAGTHSLESPVQIYTVVPQTPNPGTRYAGVVGDTIKTTLSGSPSDGGALAIVVDPSKTTGHQYEVSFKLDPDGNTLWDLKDVTLNKIVAPDQTNQAGDDNYAIIDGLMVKVFGPPPGMKTYKTAANGQRDITFAQADPAGTFAAYLEGYSGSIGMGYNYPFIATSVTPDKLKNTTLKFAAANGTWDPKTAQTDPNFSRGYRYLRASTAAPAKPSFAPWIVNPTGNYQFQDYNWSVPFAAYDIEGATPRRLQVGFLENNVAGGLVDGRYWPQANTDAGADNTSSSGPREWFFIYDLNYSDTPNPLLGSTTSNMSGDATVPLMWWGVVTRRAVDPNTAGNFRAGTEFTIIANHVNTPASKFTFTAPAVTQGDPTLAKADVGRINVFPNPYLGFNPLEENRYAKFVTFNHMPPKATVRVFNLAGVLVRTLLKNDQSQYMQWDLNNESGFPVSAGMYIVYIDMPDLGLTKTLKLGVIPEQQYLDRW